MATTQFTRTQTAGTSTKKFTVSMWFKPGIISTTRGLWGCGTGTGDGISLALRDDDTISFESWNGSVNPKQVPDRKFRDPAAWYHLVFSMDTTDVTGGDRSKIWINGVEIEDFSTDVNPVQDSVIPGWSGSGDTMKIGNRILDGDAFYTGLMSHVHVVDGTIYGPSTFGEFDSVSGIWKIKTSPSVTYGTNGGFYKFESGALTTDSSGEGNTLSQVGSPTETQDSPSNNFATLNPLAKDTAGTYTITNGNTTVAAVSDWLTMPLTLGVGGGKWFFEAKMNSLTNYAQVGWATNDFISNGGVTNYLGHTGGNNSACGYGQDGTIYYSTTTSQTDSTAYANTFTTGDVMGCALDLDNGFAYWSIDGVWQNSGDPTSGATGTGAFTIDNPTAKGYLWLPAVSLYTATWNMNTGNGYFGTTLISSPEADDGGIGAFAYDVPAGYRAVCTKNIKAYGG